MSFFLQAQNVAAIGEDLFDNRGAGDLSNGVTDRPAVVDPSQTRMQQVYARLDALDTTFDLGRREITSLTNLRVVRDRRPPSAVTSKSAPSPAGDSRVSFWGDAPRV